MTVDLNDTTNCPTAAACASCGGGTALAVAVGQTPVGVFCCTLCDACADRGRLPVLHAARAVRLSLDHCAHLGIDADRMEQVMLDEARQELNDAARRFTW